MFGIRLVAAVHCSFAPSTPVLFSLRHIVCGSFLGNDPASTTWRVPWSLDYSKSTSSARSCPSGSECSIPFWQIWKLKLTNIWSITPPKIKDETKWSARWFQIALKLSPNAFWFISSRNQILNLKWGSQWLILTGFSFKKSSFLLKVLVLCGFSKIFWWGN